MRNLYLAIILSFLTQFAFAQTKWIAHKSHSGKRETFEAALKNGIFGLESSNFGQAPSPIVKNSQLDSVIFLSNKRVIMVTSNYCENSRTAKSTLWSAGRDTISNHPLFSRKHKLDSIKKVLSEQYYFQNRVENIKFVGYDNDQGANKGLSPEIIFEKENIPVSIDKRKVHLQAEVKTEDNPTEIYVWDSAEEDGDTISLYLNGTCILTKVKITSEKRAVKVSLIPNSNNYLVLYSHNVGSKPPNTAAVLVYHKGKAKKLFLKADAKYCGALNFIYTPKGKRSEVPFSTHGPKGNPHIFLLLLMASVFSLFCGWLYGRFNLYMK